MDFRELELRGEWEQRGDAQASGVAALAALTSRGTGMIQVTVGRSGREHAVIGVLRRAPA